MLHYLQHIDDYRGKKPTFEDLEIQQAVETKQYRTSGYADLRVREVGPST